MTGVHYHAGVRAQSFHVYPVPYNVATLGQVNKLHLAIHLKTKRTQNALCPVNYRQSTQIERRKESPGIFWCSLRMNEIVTHTPIWNMNWSKFPCYSPSRSDSFQDWQMTKAGSPRTSETCSGGFAVCVVEPARAPLPTDLKLAGSELQ